MNAEPGANGTDFSGFVEVRPRLVTFSGGSRAFHPQQALAGPTRHAMLGRVCGLAPHFRNFIAEETGKWGKWSAQPTAK